MARREDLHTIGLWSARVNGPASNRIPGERSKATKQKVYKLSRSRRSRERARLAMTSWPPVSTSL